MSHSAIAALLVAASSLIAMQNKQIITTGPAPVGPYSPAVKAGGFIYLSGTLAQDDGGALVGAGDVGAQTRRVIERMRDVLKAAGASLDQVVSVTVYLKNAGDFPAMNDAYRTYWTKDPPTRTTVVADFVLPGALVEISMIAVPAGGERTVIHPKNWMRSPNPYSYAIKSGDTVFLSGLVSRNGRDNTVVKGDVTAQTKVVLDNAGELLEAAGLTHTHVVSSRVYLPDVAHFQEMNAAYRQYFSSAPPARATVQAALAGRDYAVEITLVASSSKKEVISGGRPANPNLSAAIRAGSRVYLSGILGNTPETKGDAAAQTRETLARIRDLLTAAGLTPADVVEGVVYLTDVGNFGAMNQHYRAFFERDYPARATVGTGLVAADGLVEIMMTAVKP
jgi:reactive intermediate/imine deaminase